MLYGDMDTIRKENERRIQTIRRITYLCGINIGKQTSLKNVMNALAVFLIIMSSLCVLGHICFIVANTSSIFNMTKSICTCLQTVISIIKLVLYLIAQKRFHYLIKTVVECEIMNDTTILDKDNYFTKSLQQEAKSALDESWRKSSYQIRFYVTACTAIITFYFLNALITNTYNHIIGTPNYANIFTFTTRYPGFEELKNHSPYYEFFMLVDTCADYIAGMIAASFDGFYVYITYHGVAQLKILKKMIVYSTSDKVAPNIRIPYIRECVTYYNKIIRYCEEVNDLYSIVNLTQLLISLIVLGVVLYQASVGLENDPKIFINMVLYISAGGFELVIFCFDGQNLTTESETVIEAWYSCKWYDESREFKKIIYMMMIRSKPFYISAWGFTTMTLPTFMAIVKTSGSYFMILRNVSQ